MGWIVSEKHEVEALSHCDDEITSLATQLMVDDSDFSAAEIFSRVSALRVYRLADAPRVFTEQFELLDNSLTGGDINRLLNDDDRVNCYRILVTIRCMLHRYRHQIELAA